MLASYPCSERLLEVVDCGVKLVAATCVTEPDDMAVVYRQ